MVAAGTNQASARIFRGLQERNAKTILEIEADSGR